MKISRNISDKKSVIDYLLLAILSAGIFLLHETGTARPAIQKEAIPVAASFQGKLLNIPGIYELSTAAGSQVWRFKNNRFQFSILKALSEKLDNLTSTSIRGFHEELPSFLDNLTGHFRCRSLISEDPFTSFS